MPYRTELKRPDLKGQFPCSVCGKIFCHSSSLSRHRMQAHFKSYTCTLCSQEISSNETLRSHMFRAHQISRMFMCRCCNWAFPDKTSLHIHMQSMMRNGEPGDVHILAKSCTDGDDPAKPGSPKAGFGAPGIFPLAASSREQLLNRLRQHGAPDASPTAAVAAAFGAASPNVDQQSLLASWLANNFASPWSFGSTPPRGSLADDSACADMSVDGAAEMRMASDDDELDDDDDCFERADSADRPDVTKVEPTDAHIDGAQPAAITANPMNSLMYRKNLNNALRKKERSIASFLEKFARPTDVKEEPPVDMTDASAVAAAAAAAAAEQQPSPTASDSQTSGSGAPLSAGASSDASSPLKCFECHVAKSKLVVAENTNRCLESQVSLLEKKISRQQSQVHGLESAAARHEREQRVLRDQCDSLERKLLACQESALGLLSGDGGADAAALKRFLEQLLVQLR